MAIASVFSPPPYVHRNHRFTPLFPFPAVSSLPFPRTTPEIRICADRTSSGGGEIGSQKWRFMASNRLAEISEEEERSGERLRDFEEEEADWEEQIMEETAPLVGFVRMVLRSNIYADEGRLIPKHEKVILDKLLPYHPEFQRKIGCGIDYIKVGYHPDFEGSKCLFVVRKDGVSEDFSYWKCLKGLIKKKHPIYADRFLLKHFSKVQRRE